MYFLQKIFYCNAKSKSMAKQKTEFISIGFGKNNRKIIIYYCCLIQYFFFKKKSKNIHLSEYFLILAISYTINLLSTHF